MRKIKSALALILAVLMMCSVLTVGSFAASPFSDVKENRWSYKYILTLYEDGIINGKGAGKFAPTDNITRAEFVKILGGIEGINPDSYTTLQFSDVNYKAWYAGYVAWAVRAGVTTGTSKTAFSPDAKITREQMAVMIYRYATAKNIPLTEVNQALKFADDSAIAGYAKTSVSAMQKAGIINGNKSGKSYYFKPVDNATREEASKMLCVLYSMTPKDDRGAAFEDVAIGRVLAVKRRCGLATKILEEGIQVAKEKFQADKIVLQAECYARSLYEKLGFYQTSEEFLEDNIPFIQMQLDLALEIAC